MVIPIMLLWWIADDTCMGLINQSMLECTCKEMMLKKTVLSAVMKVVDAIRLGVLFGVFIWLGIISALLVLLVVISSWLF